MGDLLAAAAAGSGVEIHGPFLPVHTVTLDGYVVPYITVTPMEGKDEIYVYVDGRFGIRVPVTKAELDNWMPILANAMAVAAGYPCHGADRPKTNPFAVRMASPILVRKCLTVPATSIPPCCGR